MRARVAGPNRESDEVKRAGRRGLTSAARLGYLTHGIVYAIMGALALLSVFGRGGGVQDGEGAVRSIGESSYGQVLLWAVAIGLACYALWNVVRALFDPERAGRDGKGVVKRVGYAVSAISHGFLATYTFQLAYGVASSGGGKARTIAQVFSLPGGRIAIGAVGLSVIGFGCYELYRALKNRVAEDYHGAQLPRQRGLILTIARVGHGARGVVLGIVGCSLIVAAIDARPQEAHGFDDALRELALQPFGSVLLGLVAAGLIAYGLHMLLLARYASIPQP